MSEDTDDSRPFTPVERKEIREMLEAQQRAEWFWKSARVWATWISAGVVGTWAAADAIEKVIRRLFS